MTRLAFIIALGLVVACGGSEEPAPTAPDAGSPVVQPVVPRFSFLMDGTSYPFEFPSAEAVPPNHWLIRSTTFVNGNPLTLELKFPRDLPHGFHCSDPLGATMVLESSSPTRPPIVWSSVASGSSCTMSFWKSDNALEGVFSGHLVWHSDAFGEIPTVISDGRLRMAYPDE